MTCATRLRGYGGPGTNMHLTEPVPLVRIPKRIRQVSLPAAELINPHVAQRH